MSVTIAGAGKLAQALAQRLPNARLISTFAPTAPTGWKADLTSIAEAEVACAGAKTLVVLAQARRPPAKLTRCELVDLDRLLADSLARAAQRCGVEHIVLYACGPDDVRASLLRASGVPVSVLHGGGPDPAAALEALVRRGPGPDITSEGWVGEGGVLSAREGLLVCSVQRYPLPQGWSAERLAKGYLEWLPGKVATVRVSSTTDTSVIHAFGTRALVLRQVPGRSEPQSCVFEVADGALARRGAFDARFEFRVLIDGSAAMVALIGFEPALPWPLYHVTQALMHERIMRRFGAWLEHAPVA
jgi:hypothetical protein